MANEEIDPNKEPTSQAAEVFRSNPDLRRRIADMKEFARFREQFNTIDVDGETLFIQEGIPMVSGGDVPMDEDQLMLEFAKRHSLTP